MLDAVQPPPVRPSFPSLPRHIHPNHTFTHMPFFFFFFFLFFFFFFFFLFRLFPSGVATADFPSPVVPIFCILLRHFNLGHVLFHHIHKPPFWPSPFLLSWQLHPHHSSPNIPIMFPTYMSIPPQSCSLLFSPNRPLCVSHMPFCSSNYISVPLQPGFLHLFDISSIFTVSPIRSFLILPNLAIIHINLNILISGTSNFCSCSLFTSNVSAPYIITGFTNVL